MNLLITNTPSISLILKFPHRDSIRSLQSSITGRHKILTRATLLMQMAFQANSKITKRLLENPLCMMPLAVLYAVLLFSSWTPDTLATLLPGSLEAGFKSLGQGQINVQFVPNAEAIGKLLSAPIASVSAWAHLQFISFFCARWIWLDGVPLHHGTLKSYHSS
jgi:hypothetical protein